MTYGSARLNLKGVDVTDASVQTLVLLGPVDLDAVTSEVRVLAAADPKSAVVVGSVQANSWSVYGA